MGKNNANHACPPYANNFKRTTKSIDYIMCYVAHISALCEQTLVITLCRKYLFNVNAKFAAFLLRPKPIIFDFCNVLSFKNVNLLNIRLKVWY